MSHERLWAMTVIVALVSLAVAAYAVLAPLLSTESAVEQTKDGLEQAISEFDTIREEEKR